MSILLFEHNQTAFDNAIEMLSVTGKAAIIHPTGTGKSFIGFKLCEQFPGNKICWLSPSDTIFRTQLENLKNASGGWKPENITFFTYAKLMLLTQVELAEIQPDYIILDEFHRCGAQMWGEGVDRLLALYPHTPLLGLSATAIRYLDNQRNMADELFDGNIASEMTLGESIVRGILNSPKYVTESGIKLYDWLVRIRMSYQRMKRGEDPPVKLSGRQIEDLTAIGMEWRTYSEMKWDTAYALAEEYFKNHGCLSVPLRYKTDSGFSLGIWLNKQRRRYEKGQLSEYCVQRLNTLQMDWRKPTKSYTWNDMFSLAQQYYLEHGHLRMPTDYKINGVWITRWVNDQRNRRNQRRKKRLTDEQIALLDSIGMEWGSKSTAVWNSRFEEAEAYYQQHGDLNVPPDYISPSGKNTKNWLERQKTNYRKGLLTQEQIRLLNTIGWQIK